MIFFHAPFPPTANNYWRIARNQVYKTSVARGYQEQLAASLWAHRDEKIEGPVSVALQFFYPDKRRRDLDNLLKVLLDALTGAGIWQDDSQVKHIEATVATNQSEDRRGLVHIHIEELEK